MYLFFFSVSSSRQINKKEKANRLTESDFLMTDRFWLSKASNNDGKDKEMDQEEASKGEEGRMGEKLETKNKNKHLIQKRTSDVVN